MNSRDILPVVPTASDAWNRVMQPVMLSAGTLEFKPFVPCCAHSDVCRSSSPIPGLLCLLRVIPEFKHNSQIIVPTAWYVGNREVSWCVVPTAWYVGRRAACRSAIPTALLSAQHHGDFTVCHAYSEYFQGQAHISLNASTQGKGQRAQQEKN